MHIVSIPSSFPWLTAAEVAYETRPDGTSGNGRSSDYHEKRDCSGVCGGLELTDISSCRQKLSGCTVRSFFDKAGTFSSFYEGKGERRVETWWNLLSALRTCRDCNIVANQLLEARPAATKTSKDKRLAIEMSMIPRGLSDIDTCFQRVEGSTMPADIVKAKGTSVFGRR